VTPNPGFKVTVDSQVEYLKKVRPRDKVAIATNRKPYLTCEMVDVWWP